MAMRDEEVLGLLEVGRVEEVSKYQLSVKLSGRVAQLYWYLKGQGFENNSRMLKLAAKTLGYLVAREKMGKPVLVGPNNRGIDEKMPLLQLLGITPDTEPAKKRGQRKSL